MAELGPSEIARLTQDLSNQNRRIFQAQYASDSKDRGTATILALFNYDRIWLGQIGIGIVKLLTFGFFGIWCLVDIFTAGARTDEYNRRKAEEILSALSVQ